MNCPPFPSIRIGSFFFSREDRSIGPRSTLLFSATPPWDSVLVRSIVSFDGHALITCEGEKAGRVSPQRSGGRGARREGEKRSFHGFVIVRARGRAYVLKN